MPSDNNKKFTEFVKNILKKIQPRFSFHYIAYTTLFLFIVFSTVSLVTATTPNPGHPWIELGDGVFTVANTQTANRTYTFPDANATVLTTNDLVTVAQGGTGVGTLTGIVKGNGTGAFSTIVSGTDIKTINGSSVLGSGDLSVSGMTWPTGGAGIPNYSGSSSWGTSYTTSGSGTVLALATSPVFVTPTLGAATATTINGLTLTAQTTGFTIAGGTTSKTLTVSNTLTLAGTDSSTLNIGTGGTLGTAAYTAASAYEVPLTFSTGLTRSTNTITNNLSTGIATGQSVVGGVAASENLTLSSTAHATKGKILMGTSAYDEVNNRFGIGLNNPSTQFEIKGLTTEAALGTEKVINGTFDTDLSSWTATTWTASSAKANYTGTTGAIATFVNGGIKLNNGGTGYTNGDVLTLTNGANDATITVTGVSSGKITSWSLTSAGTANTVSSSVSTTGGTGTGANFSILRLVDSSNTLSQNVNVSGGNAYQVSYVVTRTAGELNVTLGGASGHRVIASGTFTQVITTSGTGNLIFTPTVDFSGSIDTISVKQIASSQATASLLNSNGTSGLEFRSGGSSLGNTFVGYRSGYSNINGAYNTSNGYNSLLSNITGNYNTASGSYSLLSNTTGNQNTANGYSSLYSNTTGLGNTANGNNSLYNNTTGNYNTANGYNSLYNNITGSNNTADGYQSLYNNIAGNSNIAIGYQSLYSNTTGSYNSAIGYQALSSNTTGSNNTAIGLQSLDYNNIGSGNITVGNYSLYSNTTGSNNTASGLSSLYSNTTGSNNTASGYYSLYFNTTGSNNTANGFQSLANSGKTLAAGSFISGISYTIISTGSTDFTVCGAANSNPGTVFTQNGTPCTGTGTASSNSSNNLAEGYQAGRYIANGSTALYSPSNSLFIGGDTKALADGGTNEIVLGYNTTGNGSNTTTIGNTSTLRTYLTGLNLKAGTATAGTAPLKFTSGTVLGTTEAGAVEYDGSHLYFTAANGGTRYQLDQQSGGGLTIGSSTITGGTTGNILYNNAGIVGEMTATGSGTVLALATSPVFVTPTLGAATGTSLDLTTGNLDLDNTTFANKNGIITKNNIPFINNFNYGNNGTVTTYGYNTFIGLNSGNLTMGATATSAFQSSSNTAVGENSFSSNTLGYRNSAFGYYSLYINNTGDHNSAFGNSSLYSNTTGHHNSAFGTYVLYSNIDGNYNTALGYQAGRYISGGVTTNTTSDYSLYIGSDTKALTDGGTNEIVIGYGAIGNGSNTTTIGNTSTLRTYLTGLNLKAGSATAGTAPLKFTSGTVLGTTEAGAVEYDGSHLYFTAANGGTRYQLDQQSGGSMTWPAGGAGIPNYSGSSSWGTSYTTSGSGAILALATTPTFTTNITTPLVLGGSSTTSPLTFQTTSGVGTTGADMHFKVGNNGGTEALTILNDGNVGIGTTNPYGSLHVASSNMTQIYNETASDTSYLRPSWTSLRSRGTLSSKTSVQNGDWLGSMSFSGYESVSDQHIAAAEIVGEVSGGTPSSTSMPGSLVFSTTPVGSVAGVDRMIINHNGYVGIGTNNPLAQLQINTSSITNKGLIIQASAGQTANLLQLQDDTGGYMAGFDASGNFGTTSVFYDALNNYFALGGNNLQFANNGIMNWSSTAGYGGTKDIGISRGAAGKLYVGNGTASNSSGTLIAGSIGIGTTSPSYKLDVKGLTTTDGISSDMGFNINQVADPSAPTGVVSVGGSVDTGTHFYGVSYTTATGETHVTYTASTITTTAGNNTVTLTIPVSSDPRVTGRKIYRAKAALDYTWADYYVGTVANNTSTTYVDTVADSTLTIGSGAGFYRTNTTSNNLSVNGTKSLTIDTNGTYLGKNAGSSNTYGGADTFIGNRAGLNNTTGTYNTFLGDNSGSLNTTGGQNIAIGSDTFAYNQTGSDNVVIGHRAGSYNVGSATSISGSAIIGSMAGTNLTGSYNTILGSYAGYNLTTGAGSVVIGNDAGRYIADGTTANITSSTSTYIGYSTKALASGDANEIVIGYNAIGNGSNTATIGNTSTLRTYLTGLNLKAGTATAGTAPLKFTSGTVLGTTEAGAVEYDGSHLYFTAANGGTRYQLDQQGGSVSDGDKGSITVSGSGATWTLDLLSAVSTGASTTTSNGSGLENLTGGLTLLQGCSDGQILKWTESTGVWGCAADNSSGSIAADSLNFTELSDSLVLDASTSVAFGASTYGLTFTNNGSGNEIHNLTSTGNFVIQDNGVDTFTVDNTGYVSLGQSSSANGKLTFENSSNTNTVTLQSGATADNYVWTLPTTAPADGCLKSDASGNLSVSTCGDVNSQPFPVSGNWTIPTGALMVFVETWGGGGGGGGGSGASNNVVRGGGGGGGGASYVTSTFAAASLGTPGSTILPITVGSAGNRGNAGTNGNGTQGGVGGSSCFATGANCTGTIYVRSYGGGGGAQGVAAGNVGSGGGGGGGSLAAGTSSGTAAGGVGGGPAGSAANAGNTGSGGAGGATGTTTVANGNAAHFGGGSGGAAPTTAAVNGGNGGGSVIGGSGGGGGASAPATYLLRAGGAGGTSSALNGGGGTAGTTTGQAGGIGANGMGGGGDGGGGGANSNTGAGGAGGNGGVRGGGGGGGGAGNPSGGTGGYGGAGYVRVWSYRGAGADLAEIYGTYDQTMEAGDVVSIDETMNAGVKKTSKAYERGTIGVISTQPGLLIGSIEDPDAKPVMVALSGRVPMKVNMENGPIKKGDYLTASSTPGSAMKATKAGVVIGQSMTEYSDTTAPGYVVAFIKSGPSNGASISSQLPDGLTLVGVSDGEISLTNTSGEVNLPEKTLQQRILAYLNENKLILENSTDLSEVNADRITAGLEIITPSLYAISVSADSISSSLSDTITFGSKAKFSVPPLFNKDTAGFAIVKKGDRRVKVSYDEAYIDEPSVNASLVFNVDDNITDTSAGDLFDNRVESIVVDNSKDGFTILLNKNAPRDLRFSWNAFAVEDPKIFESVIDGLTIEQEKVILPEVEAPKDMSEGVYSTNTSPTIDNILSPDSKDPVVIPSGSVDPVLNSTETTEIPSVPIDNIVAPESIPPVVTTDTVVVPEVTAPVSIPPVVENKSSEVVPVSNSPEMTY